MSLNQVSAGRRQWFVEEEIHDLTYSCKLGLLRGWPCRRTEKGKGKGKGKQCLRAAPNGGICFPLGFA